MTEEEGFLSASWRVKLTARNDKLFLSLWDFPPASGPKLLPGLQIVKLDKCGKIIVMKQKGSAIIIAMLLISAVGAIAFSFSRSLFIDIASVSIYENGISAYYSAESGIEEGFLRLRMDKNAELPFLSDKNIAMAANGSVIRSDLTNTQVLELNQGLGVDKNTINDYSDLHQIYDLKIGSKVAMIGPTDSTGDVSTALANYKPDKNTNKEFLIPRDESKKIDLSNIFISSDVDLAFKSFLTDDSINLQAPFNDQRCVLIEAKIVGKPIGSKVSDEKKIVFYSSYPGCNYTSVFNKNDLGPGYIRQYGLSGDSVVSIQNIKSIIWPTTILSEAELYLKPIGADIAFSLTRNNPVSDAMFYGMTTKIESTGYYGGVARKIEATLDRQSGTLYDLFDYVIYKAN